MRDATTPAVQDASVVVGPGNRWPWWASLGSGKSTFARAMLGLLPENIGHIKAGRILIEGQDVTRLTPRQWSACAAIRSPWCSRTRSVS